MRVLSWGILLAVGACERSAPADAELDGLRRAAELADRAESARFGSGDERAAWTLGVGGEMPAPVTLRWPAIERLATTEYDARAAVEAEHPELARFRGVRLADLVATTHASASAPEVTLVANDGFRGTFAMADVQTWPVMLSVAMNGAPIPRSRGGPLFTTLPNVSFPQIAQRYTYSWWIFYVTHMVVGTEARTLRVGARTFDAAALDAMPRTSIRARHGFRIGWPSGEVVVSGVRIRDALAAAGVTLSATQRVRVRVKAPVPDDAEHAVRISAETIAAHDLLLAFRVGAEDTPLAARLGGPIVLAFPEDARPTTVESEWPTFVHALEVEDAP
jgi:hypothetical protein